MTDPLGQSQVLPYLNVLSKDYEIHILSAEKEENYQKNRNTISEICSNNGITWHPIMYRKSPPVLSTIMDIMTLRKKTLKLHKEHGFKILHCRSYISALVGLEMKKKFNTKFLFDMRGFWANERVDGNIWNLKIPVFKWIYKYFKKKEIEFFLQADYTISLTKSGKIEIESWPDLQINKPKIKVIPCCADLEFFSPNSIDHNIQKEYKEKLKIKNDDFIISYLGSIGTWYMLNEMLDFFNLLKKSKPNAKFLFITKDSPDNIRSSAKEKSISQDDIIIQGAERSDLPSLVSISNISIFFILPAYSKIASSPTKQAELFGLGIPVICNENVGDTGEIVKDKQVGFVISNFNENEYQEIINQIDELKNISKEHLRSVAYSYASLEIGIKKYSQIYKELS